MVAQLLWFLIYYSSMHPHQQAEHVSLMDEELANYISKLPEVSFIRAKLLKKYLSI